MKTSASCAFTKAAFRALAANSFEQKGNESIIQQKRPMHILYNEHLHLLTEQTLPSSPCIQDDFTSNWDTTCFENILSKLKISNPVPRCKVNGRHTDWCDCCERMWMWFPNYHIISLRVNNCIKMALQYTRLWFQQPPIPGFFFRSGHMC